MVLPFPMTQKFLVENVTTVARLLHRSNADRDDMTVSFRSKSDWYKE